MRRLRRSASGARFGAVLLGLLWGCFPILTASFARADPVDQARQLVATGRLREAIDLLKSAVQSRPESEPLVLALAQAYTMDSNVFWAIRVLESHVGSYPPACQSRALLALLHLGKANLDAAEEALDEPRCTVEPALLARFALVRARIAEARGESDQAEQRYAEAEAVPEHYQSDQEVLEERRARRDPGHLPLISWYADLAGGWTSNGLLGSPADPSQRSGSQASVIGVLDLRARSVLSTSRTVRPSLELGLRALQLFASRVEELSYRQPAVRPGLLLGSLPPRVLLAYAYDAVHIDAGDTYDAGPLWFSEGQRVEWELEATRDLMAFGGVGQRQFRELGRTRLEADQGLALGVNLGPRTRLLGGLTTRWYDAKNPAYDLTGAGVLLRLQQGLFERYELRAGASASHDIYLHSAGFFESGSERDRRDTLLRGHAGLWTPPLWSFRLGLDYEQSHRGSTVREYSFEDHRVTLHLLWASDSDRVGRRVVAEPWLLSTGRSARALGTDDARIQDLIRQDEAVKRGSSCLK